MSSNCLWHSFLNLKNAKIHFHGDPLWSIVVCKIPEFWRWKLWDQNFVTFDSGNIQIKESEEPGFTFSIELRTKFVWSYGPLTIVTFVDFSRAFGTIGFKTLHTLNFSKHFFVLLKDYLFYQHQYMQLDIKKSRQLYVNLEFCKGQYLKHVTDMVNNTALFYNKQMIPLFKNKARWMISTATVRNNWSATLIFAKSKMNEIWIV